MSTVGDLLVEFKERPSPGEDPVVLTLTERNGFVRQRDRFNKRLATEDISNYKVVGRGDIAFNPYLLWAGAVAQNQIVDRGVISPLYPTFRVREGHDRRYVARLLLTPQLISAYDGIAFGSVPRRRRSSVADFLSLPLENVPSIEQQHRVATILDHADALRAKRRQRLSHLDALEEAIFVSEFGDPLTNSRGLDQAPIGDVARVVTGNSPSRANPLNFGSSVEWVKSGNLGGQLVGTADEWLSDLGRAHARVAPAGSVLVTCIAGSAASIGKASLADREVAFNQQINAVLPSGRLDTMFLLAQLKVAPELVRMRSTGGMQGLVSKSSFEGIRVLVPPLKHQRAFVSKSKRIMLQRKFESGAIAAHDELFNAVQVRAFDGEL